MPPLPAARRRGRRALAVVVAVLLVGAAVVGVAAAWRGLVGGPGTDGAAGGDPVPSASRPATPSGASPDPTPSPTPTPPPDARFTIVAAGDVLPHLAVVASARTDAGHDFGPLLAPLDPWVAGADLALCHLEVPIAPDGTDPSGYPAFGAPRELAAGLAAHGWDGCSTASNHSLDRGVTGVVTTLDALDAAGLGHVGTARSAAEAATAQVYRLERAGRTLTVAHLAATYDLNGSGPADAPWAVTFLDAGDLVARAVAARAAGADLVVASVHCCVEYVTAPSQRQVAVAQELAASGAVDLVIGHHAHVPQPVELAAGRARWRGHVGAPRPREHAVEPGRRVLRPGHRRGRAGDRRGRPAGRRARARGLGGLDRHHRRPGRRAPRARAGRHLAGHTDPPRGRGRRARRPGRVRGRSGGTASARRPRSPTGPPPVVVPGPR